MNKVIYDWVSITSKIHSPQNFIEMLGLKDAVWETVKGAHGYQDRLYWEKISIHFNGREDMGIWLEMSGQGCRAFESFGTGDYEGLFQEVRDNASEMNLTRLDVAFDDLDGILDIRQLCYDTDDGLFVSRFGEWQTRNGSKGRSIEHGSMSSEIFLRIYDKAAERKLTDGTHWIRVELQLRDDRAMAFLNVPGGIGERFCGVLGNYLRYIDDDVMDSNRWRCPMQPYWARLLDGAKRIKLYQKPGIGYNMGKLEDFVFRQGGNASAAWIEIYGIEKYQERLRKRGTQQNPKYKALIDQYGRRNRSGRIEGK